MLPSDLCPPARSHVVECTIDQKDGRMYRVIGEQAPFQRQQSQAKPGQFHVFRGTKLKSIFLNFKIQFHVAALALHAA